MAWNTSGRRERLPADWARIRQRVMVRDGWVCQWSFPWGGKCGAPANQCDHINRRGGDVESNLRALCEKHHNWKSAREGNEAKREARERAEKVIERVEVDPSVLVVPREPSGRRGW